MNFSLIYIAVLLAVSAMPPETEAANTTESANTTEPVNTTESANTTDPATVTESVNTTEYVNTTEPTTITEPATTNEPVNTTGSEPTTAIHATAGITDSTTADTMTAATVSISAVVTIKGENYTEALGNVSSSEFTAAKVKWEEKLRTAYCNATSTGSGTCTITVVVRAFSRGSLVVDFFIIITAFSNDEINNLAASVLNTTDIVILDDSGVPYNFTISALTILTTQAPVTATGVPNSVSSLSNLTCFTCSTNDLTHACSIGGTISNAFSTESCSVGESCLTFKTSNTTHTSVVRKCASTVTYCDDTNSGSQACMEAQPSGGMDKMECRRCCNTNNCNHMDAGSSRPIPALLLLLVTVLTARAM